MKPCPKCGANDWKPVTEQRQVAYKACGNCQYNLVWDDVVVQDAKSWVESVAREHDELTQEWVAREQEVHDTEKPTTLQHGRLNKAKRLLAASDLKMHVADALSGVVQDTESGQITLLIPELGMFQFEWGDFNLFKAIAKVQKEAV